MTKLVVILGFLVAFAAGLIVGVNRPQQVVTTTGASGGQTTRPARGPSELDALLNLRPDQKEALKKIWSDVAEKGRKHHEQRRDELRDERDAKVQALLSAEQKSRFEQIHEEYNEQRKALEREMRANFEKAVEATKAILDPDQRARYEEWLEKRQWSRGPRGDRGGDRGPGREHGTTRRSDAGATSRPLDPS